MKEKISALLDDELDAAEIRQLCKSIRGETELRKACSTYLLIGDALRGESYLAMDMTPAVIGQLADGPFVFAPSRRNEWQRPLLAMAATIAGVAVVAWVALAPQQAFRVQEVALQRPVIVSQSEPRVASNDGDMQEYLIAHQTHSGSFYLNGDTQHIRTVSASGPGLRR
jgi:sigma-E factor negative regulatory protein RseA